MLKAAFINGTDLSVPLATQLQRAFSRWGHCFGPPATSSAPLKARATQAWGEAPGAQPNRQAGWRGAEKGPFSL